MKKEVSDYKIKTNGYTYRIYQEIQCSFCGLNGQENYLISMGRAVDWGEITDFSSLQEAKEKIRELKERDIIKNSKWKEIRISD